MSDTDDANTKYKLGVNTDGGEGTIISLDSGAQSAFAAITVFEVTAGSHSVQAQFGNSTKYWSGTVSQDTNINLAF
jgi:hypothetical protein